MKRLSVSILILLLILSITACSSPPEEEKTSESEAPEEKISESEVLEEKLPKNEELLSFDEETWASYLLDFETFYRLSKLSILYKEDKINVQRLLEVANLAKEYFELSSKSYDNPEKETYFYLSVFRENALKKLAFTNSVINYSENKTEEIYIALRNEVKVIVAFSEEIGMQRGYLFKMANLTREEFESELDSITSDLDDIFDKVDTEMKNILSE